MADECPKSPAPGFYDFDVPVGWEDEEADIEKNELYAKLFPDDPDFHEDPILKAMRLEAAAEQDRERNTARESARMMKGHVKASRKIDFNKSLSQHSFSSYETDDFMDQPSVDIFEAQGEQAWMQAYKQKAQRNRRLRKLVAAGPSSPKKTPSPQKIAQAYAKQSPAVQKAVAKALAQASPIKKFGDLNLESSDEEDSVPLPSCFNKSKVAKAGKKSFFTEPKSPSPLKKPSPLKPLPAAIKKSFFGALPAYDEYESDSDSDIDIPGLKKIPSPTKRFSVPNKSFFPDPAASPSKPATGFCLAALDDKLHDRQKELLAIKGGQKLYSPCKFLPNIVTSFLASRKGTPSYTELAVKIEDLIINAMISKLECGVTKCNPHEVLQKAKAQLSKESQQLNAILNNIDQI